MYAYESTCTRCGDNFIVEDAPGQPMRQYGICIPCYQIERRKTAAARNLLLIKWGIIIGIPVLLIFVVAYACST